MRTFLLGFVAAIVIVPAGALGYVRLGFLDVRSDAPPPAWESRLMNAAVHTAVARSAAQLTVPAAASDELLVRGGKLYAEGCAGCHGELGKPFAEDRSHYPPAPQLPHTGTEFTESQVYWIVKHGIRMTAMSAYGRFYSEEQLWSIAGFLRDIRSLKPGVAERILIKSGEGGR